MAVNDIPNSNQNNQTNRNAENINRERRQEERQEIRREPNIDRRQNNNNGVLIACSMLAGASLTRNNNMVFVNQQETQTRNFATEFIPSAIQIFETTPNNIAGGQEVVFSTNDINSGISYTYLGGNSIDIIATGIYQITFVANISGTADDQTANFAIAVNGTPITASQIVQSVDNNQTYNIKTNVIVKVTDTHTTITVLNTGTDTIEVLNANLTITKISN